MRIDWDTPIDVLMHGGDIRYIDLDPDVLVHWKYIKRVKLPNGKYRYYYDQSELDALEKEMEDAYQKRLESNVEYSVSKFNADLAKERSENAKENYFKTKDSKYFDSYEKNEKQYYDNLYKANRASDKAKRYDEQAREAKKKYNTKKITSFLDRTISKGIVAVANLLSKWFG